ncbi:hypothetical protein BHE74_00041952 [Ensete ventricosum]|uniref:Uncharacterized protein n=1 Tax=Ensete ventricosum TaxID=4639 RepID=A0A445MLI9_ENSVE|nr:hypothetical protein BHE74_00041952 [Ensete ventricosum]RZR75132.1 hypothetical protein BHM03_00050024 [Ensete ventricosum]
MDSPAAGEKEGEIWNQERGQGRLVDRDFVGRGHCDLVLIARSTGDSYGKPNLLSHDTDPKKDAAFSFCELINSEKERRVRQGSDIFLSFTCVSHLVLYGWFFGDGVTDRSIDRIFSCEQRFVSSNVPCFPRFRTFEMTFHVLNVW